MEKLKYVNSDVQSENEKQATMTKDLLASQSKSKASNEQTIKYLKVCTQLKKCF